jgi:aldose 1-epimerase
MATFQHEWQLYPDTDYHFFRLTCTDSTTGKERLRADITPDNGMNLFSLQVDGTELMMDRGPIVDNQWSLGTYILYPSPGRMEKAKFTFDGRKFRLQPNWFDNQIHGLVRFQRWEYDEPTVNTDGISLTARIEFEPDTPLYREFPVRNRLEVTMTLHETGLRYDFVVTNRDRDNRLPFGLAIHPFFNIIGDRRDVRLKVPATHVLENVDLIPTGKRLPLNGHPADLREIHSLESLDLDEIYFGVTPDSPPIIWFDDSDRQLTLTGSELFSHCVVYTPAGQSFFCVENQSCAADAHNLHSRKKDSGLSILEPGESMTAWIDLTISRT